MGDRILYTSSTVAAAARPEVSTTPLRSWNGGEHLSSR